MPFSYWTILLLINTNIDKRTESVVPADVVDTD
jgi:hypothetical protein